MAILASYSTSPLPTIVGSGVTTDTVGFGKLPPDALLMTQVASTACAGRWNYSATSALTSIRFYLRMPSAWPSAVAGICSVLDSAFTSQMVRIVLPVAASPGQITLRNSAAAVIATAPANAVALNQILRFELWGNQTASTTRLQVFPWGSDQALWDTGSITLAFASPFGVVTLGNQATTPTLGPIGIDELVATDGNALIGRHESDNPFVNLAPIGPRYY